MRKTSILIILLFIAILIVLFPVGYKYFTKSPINTTPEKENVYDEKTIDLRGVSDPKKLVYETKNAIIKFSYDSTTEYFLQEIKKYKELVKESELSLATGKYEGWQMGDKIKDKKITIKEGEDFINWLETRNNTNEINITDTPHNKFLKDVDFETDISILLSNGEVDVFDRISSQNVKFITFKRISTESYHIKRYYLPSNQVFFEKLYPVIE